MQIVLFTKKIGMTFHQTEIVFRGDNTHKKCQILYFRKNKLLIVNFFLVNDGKYLYIHETNYRIRSNYCTVRLGFFKLTGKMCSKISI